ncbi:MAG: biopolymer transporter ExbD [Bacteroidales bacterium]
MAKIRKEGKKTPPAISTASLPDIVFMLLFFFMVSTTMRESSLMIKKPTLPKATEITKLEKKSLVSNIYVAPPAKEYESIYGTQPVIQLNEAIEDVSKIPQFIQKEREARNPNERELMSVSLKADKNTKMGIISDIKMELRRINALKLNYAALDKQ